LGARDRPGRTLVEEPTFKQQVADLRLSVARLDECLKGLGWLLARAPELFPLVPDTKLRRAKLRNYAPGVVLDVWFSFDEQNVFLHAIEPLIPPEE
jgi:hypothetical protein